MYIYESFSSIGHNYKHDVLSLTRKEEEEEEEQADLFLIIEEEADLV